MKLNTVIIDIPATQRKMGKFKAQLYAKLAKTWDMAVIEFVRTAALESDGGGGIHIETGMSAASLIPALYNVRFVETASYISSISSQIMSRRTAIEAAGLRTSTGQYLPASQGYKRSFEQGIVEGTDGTRITYGPVANPIFEFYFDIRPFQWVVNEDYWGVLELAESAFVRHLKLTIPNLFDDDDLRQALTPEITIK